MKTIEEMAHDYAVLKNGKPMDNKYLEITENGLYYQVTKAFMAGAEFHPQLIVSEKETINKKLNK